MTDENSPLNKARQADKSSRRRLDLLFSWAAAIASIAAISAAILFNVAPLSLLERGLSITEQLASKTETIVDDLNEIKERQRAIDDLLDSYAENISEDSSSIKLSQIESQVNLLSDKIEII